MSLNNILLFGYIKAYTLDKENKVWLMNKNLNFIQRR